MKWGQTHTEADTMSCIKENNNCEDGTNVVIQSIVIQCSPGWLLFTQQRRARGEWEVLGDPALSDDLSLKSNRWLEKIAGPSLLNYITVVYQPNCVHTCVLCVFWTAKAIITFYFLLILFCLPELDVFCDVSCVNILLFTCSALQIHLHKRRLSSCLTNHGKN